ncbi:MAG: hypothetical protein ACXIUQ_10925 [Cecembia sp.]
MNGTESLLEMMKQFNLPVLTQHGKHIETQNGYVIEVEGPDLYKLIHLGDVIAPFDDLEELCGFIKTYS